MKCRIIGIWICVLLITALFPLTTLAGDADNPEITDRTRDVFGLFGFFPQFFFRHIDIRSAWFYEEINNPDYLYVSLEIRALEHKTKMLNAIYVVDWIFNNNYYATCVHTTPNGVVAFLSGKTNNIGNDFEDYVICEGIFDEEKNIITWMIPKYAIGNPQPNDLLTSTSAVTTLRCTEESGLPQIDLLKDIALKGNKDYTIQY